MNMARFWVWQLPQSSALMSTVSDRARVLSFLNLTVLDPVLVAVHTGQSGGFMFASPPEKVPGLFPVALEAHIVFFLGREF
jgi:hypothetical protein